MELTEQEMFFIIVSYAGIAMKGINSSRSTNSVNLVDSAKYEVCMDILKTIRKTKELKGPSRKEATLN